MNVVVLIGRLTDNPELRHTNSNIAVTRFSIAVDRGYRSGEERQTDFINIVAWRQTAEFITTYFKKGQRIAIEGSLRMNRYQDKDGNNRTSYEVVVNNAHFVETKSSANGGFAPAAEQAQPASFSNTDSGDFAEIVSDDDLPF